MGHLANNKKTPQKVTHFQGRWRSFGVAITLLFGCMSVMGQPSLHEKCHPVLTLLQQELQRSYEAFRLRGLEMPLFMGYYLRQGHEFAATFENGNTVKISYFGEKNFLITEILIDHLGCLFIPAKRYLLSETDRYWRRVSSDTASLRHLLWISTEDAFREALAAHANTPQGEGPYNRYNPPRNSVSVREMSIVSSQDSTDCIALSRAVSAASLSERVDQRLRTTCRIYTGHYYHVSNLHVMVQIPFSITEIKNKLSATDSKGRDREFTSEWTFHNVENAGLLDSVLFASRAWLRQVQQQLELPEQKEPYRGPVWIEGNKVSQLMRGLLLGKAGSTPFGLMGNASVQANSLKAISPWLVLDSSLSVTWLPRALWHNDQPLRGAIDIDFEGSVPPEQLSLVKHGTVQTLFSLPLLAPGSDSASGIWFPFVRGEIQTEAYLPGTLRIHTENGASDSLLWSRVINEGRAQNLSYILVVGETVRRHYIASGKEEEVFCPGIIDEIIALAPMLQRSKWRFTASEQVVLGPSFSTVCPSAMVISPVSVSNHAIREPLSTHYITRPEQAGNSSSHL